MRVFACLLLLCSFTSASAGTVYRCKGSGGSVTYADVPCGHDAQEVTIRGTARTQPDFASAPVQDASAPATQTAPPASAPTPAAPAVMEAEAYQCSTPDGMVFYRHAHCPKNIAVVRYGQLGRFQTEVPTYAPVEEAGVSRDRACAAIYAHDASQRSGSEHDQRYTTFARNAGDDPCK